MKRLSIFVICAALAVTSQPALAQEAASSPNDSILSVVGKQVQIISANRGQKIEGDITVRNSTANTVAVHSKVDDFVSANDSGDPKIIDESKGEKAPTPFAEWTHVSPESTSLSGNKDFKFHYEIAVPANASPGGHYGAIGFGANASANANGDSHVAIDSYIYTLFLVNVRGAVHYSAKITKIDLHKVTNAAGLSHYEVATTIKNIGNSHFRPSFGATIDGHKGEVGLKKWPIGSPRYFPLDSTFVGKNDAGYILPNSERTYHSRIPDSELHNFYKVNVKALFGPTGGPFQTVASSKLFWFGPSVSTWVILILLFLLVLLIILLAKRRKKEPKSSRAKFAKQA